LVRDGWEAACTTIDVRDVVRHNPLPTLPRSTAAYRGREKAGLSGVVDSGKRDYQVNGMRWVAILVAVFVGGGCAGEPFSRPAFPVLKDPKPGVVREEFSRKVPEGNHGMHASSIRFPFMDMTVLEKVVAEAGKEEVGVQGYMPMGMLLFDVSAGKGSVRVNSAVAEFGKYKFIVEAIGRDVREAFVDLSPGASAGAKVLPREVMFTEKTAGGTLSYEYAYDPPVLIEKRLSNFWGTVWRIRYYDYRAGEDGKLRPGGIVVDDRRNFFRIVLDGRELKTKVVPELRDIE
jgi:hypothetical protein